MCVIWKMHIWALSQVLVAILLDIGGSFFSDLAAFQKSWFVEVHCMKLLVMYFRYQRLVYSAVLPLLMVALPSSPLPPLSPWDLGAESWTVTLSPLVLYSRSSLCSSGWASYGWVWLLFLVLWIVPITCCKTLYQMHWNLSTKDTLSRWGCPFLKG